MIVGKVLATGEAVVTITVRGPGGQQARVEAMLDTGFNDDLTLPPWVIERLQLPFEDEVTYTLGDGARSGTRIYLANIEWHGQWREVTIVELDHDALLGTGAVMGSNLNIDWADGGHVVIQPLTTNGTN